MKKNDYLPKFLIAAFVLIVVAGTTAAAARRRRGPARSGGTRLHHVL